MVQAVHSRGVLLGDLSADNVLIDPLSGSLWLIDFESAAGMEDDADWQQYAVRWTTPGFCRPERLVATRLCPEDDLFALAMVLFNALAGVERLFDLHPDARMTFLRRFTELGIPPEAAQVIAALVNGDASTAEAILGARPESVSFALPAD